MPEGQNVMAAAFRAFITVRVYAAMNKSKTGSSRLMKYTLMVRLMKRVANTQNCNWGQRVMLNALVHFGGGEMRLNSVFVIARENTAVLYFVLGGRREDVGNGVFINCKSLSERREDFSYFSIQTNRILLFFKMIFGDDSGI